MDGSSDIQSTERDEQRTCEQHGNYMAHCTVLKMFRTTREQWSDCPGCVEEREARDRELRRLTDEALERQQRETFRWDSRIPARYWEARFATYLAPTDAHKKALEICIQYAAEFEARRKSGEGLLLIGGPGTGKTHLAVSILHALYGKATGCYSLVSELIREVRGTWRRDSEKTEAEVFKSYSGCTLLVLDELGATYGSDGEQTLLFDILDSRYRELRPTIIISNQNTAGLKQYIGERAYDRLRENAQLVPFNWDSYRPEARQNQGSDQREPEPELRPGETRLPSGKVVIGSSWGRDPRTGVAL